MKQRMLVGASGLLAASLFLSACGAIGLKSPADSSLTPSSDGQNTAEKAPLPELQKFYDQTITWNSCVDNGLVMDITDGRVETPNYTCAQLEVPLDYNKPAGETIKLQLVRYSSDGEVKIPLFYNPGGPGGSAISGLDDVATGSFTIKLLKKYDLIAMDPRGVGASTPVKCLTPEEIDKQRSGEDIPEGVDEADFAQQQIAEYTKKCLDNSGELAKNIDTNSVVSDFDIARAALRQEKLNYFGYSYGTVIGALYTDTFRNRVDHIVLDSAVDTALTAEGIAEGQAEGFEKSMRHFLESSELNNEEFPFRGPKQAEDFKAWIEAVDKTPIPTHDPNRPLTGSLLRSAVMGGMYSEDFYQFISEGIVEAKLKNNGTVLLNISDLLNERRTNGTYKTNSFDAFQVVNYLDYVPVGTEADWLKQAEELKAKYPLVGDQFAGSSAMLSASMIPSRDTRRTVKGAGAPPVLVIGNTYDPATPYKWSVSLADQLESAQLITVESWDHGAYRRLASKCVTDAVDNYFLENVLPAKDLRCEK
ncbi:alpha/beta hydrolase [Gleimia sp. 6138-11-ORH1]|uniref:alpha/beta hydrolase n=1 Tax=Gleimia sp. 6138-11-ORH1 TaxID=2973937 RepID=UPI0021682D4E|nr:alpha/beta hydrolase [Gleimia sp. 6138-11-ORH1]MCS4484981.1 alpha/beta hydrolase [Gleimia sp. 6138-11-ORH1]